MFRARASAHSMSIILSFVVCSGHGPLAVHGLGPIDMASHSLSSLRKLFTSTSALVVIHILNSLPRPHSQPSWPFPLDPPPPQLVPPRSSFLSPY